MASTENPFEGIAGDPPDVDAASVAKAVGDQFDLRGELTRLVSERDQNFLLQTDDGRRFVVKVTSAAEPHRTTRFHVATLLHLERNGSVATPTVVTTTSDGAIGSIQHAGQEHLLRLVSYLEGQPMSAISLDAQMAAGFGAQLALLDLGLAGFSHEGDSPALLWDLQRAGELTELSCYIDDASTAERVAQATADFEQNVRPELRSLRRQVIHGDANPENVLVDASGQVTGFIDFSDSVSAPLVFDPAIACAYLRADADDALALITPFLAAYHAELSLEPREIALLFDLVRARLATTISIMYWRLALRSASDPYSVKTVQSEGGASEFLAALDALGRGAFIEGVEQALGGG